MPTTLRLAIAIVFAFAWTAHAATPATLPTTVPDESGAYYDWTITKQPERPFLHHFDQTLMMGLFLSAKQPKDDSKVFLTFEQALEVIKKLDNLTCGAPKIIILVGWQYNGHDSKYPALAEVNQRLKRAQDATAVDSLKWLMAEGFKYHTTITLHINMFDAYRNSPLWDEYVAKDVIAKDLQGNPFAGPMWPTSGTDEYEDRSYQISHAREWDMGLAQRRIDGLLAMLPIQKAGVIHIDAFHTLVPKRAFPRTISPFLGYPPEQEAAAQRKIFRYFRDRGVDVTAEMSSQYRVDPFIGLQPWAMHFKSVGANVPPSLYCGTPMVISTAVRKDPANLPGVVDQFCNQAVPWLYTNRYYTSATTAPSGMENYLDHPTSTLIGGQQVLTADDLCIPATWTAHGMIAWSKNGYAHHAWPLPPGWEGVQKATVSEITADGPKLISEIPVNAGIDLTLKPSQGVIIAPE